MPIILSYYIIKIKNIINYSKYGNEYSKLIHTLTTEKETLNEIDISINKNVKSIEKQSFKNLFDVIDKLNYISITDEANKKITKEGYLIKYYFDKPLKSNFIVLKLQTNIYKQLIKNKPNNINVHQNYLELYQKDKLVDYLPYFTKYTNDITKRIHLSMKNIAKEILDLYHCTRQKNNPHIYNILLDQYKKILYGLHGLYISHRKSDFFIKSS